MSFLCIQKTIFRIRKVFLENSILYRIIVSYTYILHNIYFFNYLDFGMIFLLQVVNIFIKIFHRNELKNYMMTVLL